VSFVVELGFYPIAHAIPTAAAAIEQVHQLLIDPAAVLEHGAKRNRSMWLVCCYEHMSLPSACYGGLSECVEGLTTLNS
jgi:hypothetical protein